MTRSEPRSRAAEADDRLRLRIREAHEQEQSLRQVRDECRQLLAEMRSVVAEGVDRERIRESLDTHINHVIEEAVNDAIGALPEDMRAMLEKYVNHAGAKLVDRALEGLRDDIRETLAVIRTEEREKARNDRKRRGVLGI